MLFNIITIIVIFLLFFCSMFQIGFKPHYMVFKINDKYKWSVRIGVLYYSSYFSYNTMEEATKAMEGNKKMHEETNFNNIMKKLFEILAYRNEK